MHDQVDGPVGIGCQFEQQKAALRGWCNEAYC